MPAAAGCPRGDSSRSSRGRPPQNLVALHPAAVRRNPAQVGAARSGGKEQCWQAGQGRRQETRQQAHAAGSPLRPPAHRCRRQLLRRHFCKGLDWEQVMVGAGQVGGGHQAQPAHVALAGQLRRARPARGARVAPRLQQALRACGRGRDRGSGVPGWRCVHSAAGRSSAAAGAQCSGQRPGHSAWTGHSAAAPSRTSPAKAAAPGASGFLAGKPMRTRVTAEAPGGAGGGTACSSSSSCRWPSFMATAER